MLRIEALLVTQPNIRDFSQLSRMIEFVKDGGFFTANSLSKHQSRGKVSPVIEVTCFEDGKLFLHDGHHRGVSVVLGERDFLDSTEYRIRYFTYEQYRKLNLESNWWTPFDPITEVRLTDMSEYKSLIRSLINANATEEEIIQVILSSKHLYAEPRKDILSLLDLAHSINFQ